MQIPGNKKVVCISGSVWTGSQSAPRHMLVKDGFLRPTWFTTGRALTDAKYRHVTETHFHLANAEHKVLAHIEYGGDFIGVMREDFEAAITDAAKGILVVAPPEIAAQLAAALPQTIVFSFNDAEAEMSRYFDDAGRTGQLHRIDIDALDPGAWKAVYRTMMDIIGLPARDNPF
jgi:hypothetical protein